MNRDIYVIAEHLKGKLADITFEMSTKGRELTDSTGGKLYLVLIGKGSRNFVEQLSVADTVIVFEHDQLTEFNPEAYLQVLAELIGERQPWLTLLGNTSTGLDLAAPLSARLGIPLVAYCRGLRLEEGRLLVTSQLYGGKMLVDVEVERAQAIVSILPGAFRAERLNTGRSPSVEVHTPKATLDGGCIHFERLIEPEAGDVDITQAPVLVSIGRGIQSQDNLAVAEELAAAMGGVVSASRPVVDQGWLPMTRQVGRSGMQVKPRLYLALGISGAPEHVEGMRDSDLIVAVNTDPNAPIFNLAHYGVVGDVLEFVPALTEAMRKKSALT